MATATAEVGRKQQVYSPRALSSSFRGAFGFLIAASLLSIIVPYLVLFRSRLPSLSGDDVVYVNVDRGTLFFLCNVLLLFLARDSGFLVFFAPANAMHDESHLRSAAVAGGDDKVGVLDRQDSLGSLEFENAECSQLIDTGAVESVENDEVLDEAVMFSSDLELDGDGTESEEEEMDPAENVEHLEQEHEDLEEFNRRCDEFITRMKSGKRIDHAVGGAEV